MQDRAKTKEITALHKKARFINIFTSFPFFLGKPIIFGIFPKFPKMRENHSRRAGIGPCCAGQCGNSPRYAGIVREFAPRYAGIVREVAPTVRELRWNSSMC